MFKKLFSYFIPINIYRKKSAVSKDIEVTWNNGQLVIDSKSTNYSYGSLQRILRKGLKAIGFEKIRTMQNILVLGVAGGSVVKTLADEIGCKGRITGVEIDPEIIEIAKEYFHIGQIPNFEIIIDDAFEFVLKTEQKYDLIIIDIFQDTTMPNFLFEKFFIDRIGFLLNDKGFMLFNTMLLDNADEIRNNKYVSEFDTSAFEVSRMPRVETHNELILAQKLNKL